MRATAETIAAAPTWAALEHVISIGSMLVEAARFVARIQAANRAVPAGDVRCSLHDEASIRRAFEAALG